MKTSEKNKNRGEHFLSGENDVNELGHNLLKHDKVKQNGVLMVFVVVRLLIKKNYMSTLFYVHN